MRPHHDQLRYDMVLFDVGGTLIGFVEPEPFRQFLTAAGQPDSEGFWQMAHAARTDWSFAEDARFVESVGADDESDVGALVA